jgi:hypothetical protein
MRDLAFILLVTLVTVTIWIGVSSGGSQYYTKIPKEILEASLPLNGTIDVEFINNLKLINQPPSGE